MAEQSLSHNTVGYGDELWRCALAVGVDGEHLVESPRERAVVEYHALAVGYSCGILSRGATVTHTEADVAHDDVVGTRKRHSVAIDDDAFARGCLSCHVEILGENDARIDFNHTCHIENDDAVGLADGVAQRAGAAVVEVGHVIDASCAASRSEASPPLRLRKGQLLGGNVQVCAGEHSSQQQ